MKNLNVKKLGELNNIFIHLQILLSKPFFAYRFATVNLYDLVKNSELDIERLTVLVYATKYSHEPIAQLTIQIEGVNYLRNLLSE